MMSFSEDTDFARSILARISLYLVSLLDERESSFMAYSILSPYGALSCKPTPTPFWQEESSTLRVHQSVLPWSTSSYSSSAKKIYQYLPLQCQARFVLNTEFT